MFLLSENKKYQWSEWFPCRSDKAIKLSHNSKETYYSCIKDLIDWGLIEYKKGLNGHNTPIVKIIYYTENRTLQEIYYTENRTLQENKSESQNVRESVEKIYGTTIENENHYNLLIENIKPILDNIKSVIKYMNKTKRVKKEIPLIRSKILLFSININTIEDLELKEYFSIGMRFVKMIKEKVSPYIKLSKIDNTTCSQVVHIKRLIEDDGFKKEDLWSVYCFLRDEEFNEKFNWFRVVLSLEGLRKHAPKILSKVNISPAPLDENQIKTNVINNLMKNKK